MSTVCCQKLNLPPLRLPRSPLCFEPIQTSYNVRDTGLPPSRDDWGPHPQREGGPVVHRGPLLRMLGRQSPFWNCQPLRNIQKNYQGWCLVCGSGMFYVSEKLMTQLCWLGMNKVFFIFWQLQAPCVAIENKSEFLIMEIHHNPLILNVFFIAIYDKSNILSTLIQRCLNLEF